MLIFYYNINIIVEKMGCIQKIFQSYCEKSNIHYLFNVKYLPLFHHFKAIYQFPKHIIVIFLVKIVANASLRSDSKLGGPGGSFIIYLQANNLTSLSPYATDLTSDR
jgi:hypothetical protein